MKTLLIDSNDDKAMVESLKSKGYLVFKNTKDLTYPEVNLILDLLVREGFQIVSTR